MLMKRAYKEGVWCDGELVRCNVQYAHGDCDSVLDFLSGEACVI